MIIVAGDIETTGLSAPDGDRITEIALAVWQLKDGLFTCAGEFSELVNPERSIPAYIQNLTGITPAMVATADKWDVVAPKVAKILNAASVFIAHNADFDAPFIGHELLRVGQPINPKMEVFCTLKNGYHVSALGKPPSLRELCWAYEVEYDPNKAHRAIYDVRAMMEAFVKGVYAGDFTLPDISITVEEAA